MGKPNKKARGGAGKMERKGWKTELEDLRIA